MKKSIMFFTAAITLFLSVGALADKDLDFLLQQFKKYQDESTQKKEVAGSTREQINSYVHENYTRIYLVLMKNSDSSQGPVLWGGALELAVIANKYKISIEVIDKDTDEEEGLTIGNAGPIITIQRQGGHYQYINASGQLVDVPRDGNCMFNAVLEAAKANGLTQIPQNVAELRSEVVKWLQEDPTTSTNLQNLLSGGDAKLNGVHTLEEIMEEIINDFISNPVDADPKYIELYQKAVEYKNVRAQFSLSCCYGKGIGIAKNETKAFEWYKKVAEQGGSMLVQYKLGVCYEAGIGTAKNETEAFEWYKKAANQGNVRAQFSLSCCYEKGIGTAKNETKAFEWYKKAAEQENMLAQCNLGVCYEKGIGTAKNETEAFEWYKKAANQGHMIAQFNLGVCYEKGIDTAKNETEAFEWYKKAANGRYVKAQCKLGSCYEKGIGTAKNETEAFEWYKKAANQGHVKAQLNLGNRYIEGEGTVKNETEAFKWYKKAANQGHVTAQFNLGVCYEDGIGTVKNETEAFKWYKKAAEQDCAEAKCNLGLCYGRGIGTVKNETEAFKWYKKAAEQGVMQVQPSLGYCYEHGVGTIRCLAMAIVYYQLAEQQGSLGATIVLERMGKLKINENKFRLNGRPINKLSLIGLNKAEIEYQIARLYRWGIEGTEQNYQEAAKWYKLAADQGYDLAQRELGICYRDGIGVSKDVKKALELVKASAANRGIENQQSIVIMFNELGLQKIEEEKDIFGRNKTKINELLKLQNEKFRKPDPTD